MKKKLLALALCVALSFGLAAGAQAATSQENARAYLTQTMDVLKSEKYTVHVRDPLYFSEGREYVRNGNVTATVDEFSFPASWVFGKRRVIVDAPDVCWIIYPDRRFYIEEQLMPQGDFKALKPIEIPATPLEVVYDNYTHGRGLEVWVKVDGVTYQYFGGMLYFIDGGHSQQLAVHNLRPTVDQSLFSTEHMWKMPGWLYRALQKLRLM